MIEGIEITPRSPRIRRQPLRWCMKTLEKRRIWLRSKLEEHPDRSAIANELAALSWALDKLVSNHLINEELPT